MKYIALLIILLCPYSFAQKEQKQGSMFKADAYWKSGNLDKAKAEIDLVASNPKKAKNVSLWLLRGYIYKALLLTDNYQYAQIDSNAGVTAAKSFERVLQLHKKHEKKSTYYVEAFNAKEEIWGHYVAQAVSKYKIEDYEEAYELFNKSRHIKPQDSISLSYTGYNAMLIGKYDTALTCYYKLIELEKADVDIYKSIVSIEKDQKKDSTAVEKILEQAIEKYPNEPFFLKSKLILLIQQNRQSEVSTYIENLQDIITQDARILIYVASFYDDIGTRFIQEDAYDQATPYLDTAILYYKKALDDVPENLSANYNISLVYVRKSKKYFGTLAKMDNKSYYKNKEKFEKRGREFLTQALPFTQRAYELDPDDIQIITLLQQIYHRLGKKTEAALYQEKLNKLEADKAKK